LIVNFCWVVYMLARRLLFWFCL